MAIICENLLTILWENQRNFAAKFRTSMASKQIRIAVVGTEAPALAAALQTVSDTSFVFETVGDLDRLVEKVSSQPASEAHHVPHGYRQGDMTCWLLTPQIPQNRPL